MSTETPLLPLVLHVTQFRLSHFLLLLPAKPLLMKVKVSKGNTRFLRRANPLDNMDSIQYEGLAYYFCSSWSQLIG